MTLPDCMMPDGADPCIGFYETQADLDRLLTALRSYASHQPLDVKTPSQIQRDLHAIAGSEHMHVASLNSDRCFLCKRDLRHEVHTRVITQAPLGHVKKETADD